MYRRCVLLLTLAYISQATQCPSVNTFYEDMGCNAIFQNSTDPCPIKFDCSNIKKASDSQCFFLGKFFDPDSQHITEAEEHCRFLCHCTKGSAITCAEFQCSQYYQLLEIDCFHSLGFDCCPQKVICKSDKNLTTCSYNNQTYLEGVSFYPDACTHCVCQKGFKGKLEEPFCKRIKCLVDEMYYEIATNKCAPIYIKNHCCPVASACATQCPSVNTFYEDVGCNAIFKNSTDPCPIKFDCSNIKKKSDGQCFFLGKFFDPDSGYITEAQEHCRFACRCTKGSGITCGEFDCPEYYQPVEKDCFHSLGFDCCPDKVICKSDKNLTTCSYNNQTYLEGVTFYPDACTHCVCQKGFNGKLEEPFCKRVKCLVDEMYYKIATNKCAPIYIKNHCCPVASACADGDEIVTPSPRTTTDTDYTCQFGTRVLNIGDEAEVKNPVKATCKCITPPFITCTSNVDYPVIANL